MTEVTEERAPDPLDALPDLPAEGTGARSRGAGRTRWVPQDLEVDVASSPVEVDHDAEETSRSRFVVLFAAAVVVLAIAIPSLAYVGFEAVSDSNDGSLISGTSDPDEPGFEAQVEPTPVLLALTVHRGELLSGTVLALGSGDAGGSVVFVPSGTIVRLGGLGDDRLAVAYQFGGAELAGTAVEEVLDISVHEIVVLDDARWAELLAPIGPLGVVSPDRVEVPVPDRDPREFPADDLDIAPSDIGAYLAATAPGQTELSRLARHEAVWTAWLQAVAASTEPQSVPGEIDVGLGRFVRALAAGVVDYETLPVGPRAPDFFGQPETFAADPVGIEALVVAAVPFPESPTPGGRLRVRILDGTGTPGLVNQAVGLAIEIGAEVKVVGNADDFDHATTTFIHSVPAASLDALVDAVGVGQLDLTQATVEDIDVTIVLGRDFAGRVS